MYPAELVKPMREHLTQVGFEELHTAEAVDTYFSRIWDDFSRGKLGLWLCSSQRSSRCHHEFK